ncbi:MAG: hypothetical protein R2867_07885 [Caldilineaceae bacterium]
MTPEEKFMFDLEGYIVIKKCLDAGGSCCVECVGGPTVYGKAGTSRPSAERGFPVGPEAQALIDHPKIVPYLLELLGPKFRIDHDYCIFMTKGGRAGGLHGGEGHSDGEADHWYRYRDGVMRNGLTVVTFFLTHADQGDGGFACAGQPQKQLCENLPDDVRMFERVPHYVTQPAVAAGDALIFTEALIHGTMPWAADHERRALLYKFSPGHSSWANTYYNPADYPTATEQQIRIMAAPSVGRRPNSIAEG